VGGVVEGKLNNVPLLSILRVEDDSVGVGEFDVPEKGFVLRADVLMYSRRGHT